MLVLSTILLVLALVCFFASAVQLPSPRVNLIALGLMLWVLTVLLSRTVSP
jgi:hypothetical protein